MTQCLLLISPVRNEEAYLELVAEAVAAQTRPPDLWLVVDDGSTDRTPEILPTCSGESASCRSSTPRQLPAVGAVRDRLATAAEARAFNLGLGTVAWDGFTHIAKLDGDTELPANYFETLLGEFELDPTLGLAGGVYADPDPGGEGEWDGDGDGWKVMNPPSEYHVPGTLKCYSTACFQAIGGMQERLAWDTIDETYARMHGYRTRAYPSLIARHHRPWGSADGTLRGRPGTASVPTSSTSRSRGSPCGRSKSRCARPRGLSGVAFLYGYLRSAARRVPRVEDPAFARFVRGELRARILSALGLAKLRGRLDRRSTVAVEGIAEEGGC